MATTFGWRWRRWTRPSIISRIRRHRSTRYNRIVSDDSTKSILQVIRKYRIRVRHVACAISKKPIQTSPNTPTTCNKCVGWASTFVNSGDLWTWSACSPNSEIGPLKNITKVCKINYVANWSTLGQHNFGKFLSTNMISLPWHINFVREATFVSWVQNLDSTVSSDTSSVMHGTIKWEKIFFLSPSN
jgi:hypothetical protein